jgi:hypothetical protein
MSEGALSILRRRTDQKKLCQKNVVAILVDISSVLEDNDAVRRLARWRKEGGVEINITQKDISSELCQRCAACCDVWLTVPKADPRYRMFLCQRGLRVDPPPKEGRRMKEERGRRKDE